jgi:hypothetical protein
MKAHLKLCIVLLTIVQIALTVRAEKACQESGP